MKKIILGITATVLFSTASFAKSGEVLPTESKAEKIEVSAKLLNKVKESIPLTCLYTVHFFNSSGQYTNSLTYSTTTSSVAGCNAHISRVNKMLAVAGYH